MGWTRTRAKHTTALMACENPAFSACKQTLNNPVNNPVLLLVLWLALPGYARGEGGLLIMIILRSHTAWGTWELGNYRGRWDRRKQQPPSLIKSKFQPGKYSALKSSWSKQVLKEFCMSEKNAGIVGSYGKERNHCPVVKISKQKVNAVKSKWEQH